MTDLDHRRIILKRNRNLPHAILPREVPESLRDVRRAEDFQWIKGLDFTITVKPHYVLQQPVITSSTSSHYNCHSVKPVVDWDETHLAQTTLNFLSSTSQSSLTSKAM